MARRATDGMVVSHGLARGLNALLATTFLNDQQRLNCYFNLTTFIHPQGAIGKDGKPHLRSQNNADRRRTLILDADTKVSHPTAQYADQPEAKAVIERMCDAEGLPHPTFVNSGGGLHCYWSFDRDLTQAEWLRYAAALKAACKAHNIHCDHQVTINFVGVLRPIGTHHVKTGSVVKLMSELRGPYSWSAFDHLVEKYAAELNSQPKRQAPKVRRCAVVGKGGAVEYVYDPAPPTPAMPARSGGSPIADAVRANIYDEAPTDPELIRRRCRQFRAFCASAGDRGNPDWHAVNRLLAFCKPDGLRCAQDLGDGYHDHDRADTDAWIANEHERARSEITGPTTCRRFEEINPGGCDGCLHRGHITTPATLGRRR
jgi:hypothetical protein